MCNSELFIFPVGDHSDREHTVTEDAEDDEDGDCCPDPHAKRSGDELFDLPSKLLCFNIGL